MRAREDPRKCIRWERKEREEERKEGKEESGLSFSIFVRQ